MTPTLNQQYLHERVAADAVVPMEVVKRVLNSYQDVVARALAGGEGVMQTNFMTFLPVDKPARMARNPQTGERVEVPATRAVKVAVAPRLTEIVRLSLTEVDGHPVTLRKLPKGAAGVMPVVTADPNAVKLKVRVVKPKPKRRRRSTPRSGKLIAVTGGRS